MLTDKQYKTYLKSYKDTYKVIRQIFDKQSDDIWCIYCQFGTIQPWSMRKENNLLLFEWEFNSMKKGNRWIRSKPDYCIQTAGDNREGVMTFPESKLVDDKERLEKFFEIRKKKQFSPESLKNMTDRLKPYYGTKKRMIMNEN